MFAWWIKSTKTIRMKLLVLYPAMSNSLLSLTQFTLRMKIVFCVNFFWSILCSSWMFLHFVIWEVSNNVRMFSDVFVIFFPHVMCLSYFFHVFYSCVFTLMICLQSFYTHVFNGCYAVLLFIVVIFFLIYGVEVFFKVSC